MHNIKRKPYRILVPCVLFAMLFLPSVLLTGCEKDADSRTAAVVTDSGVPASRETASVEPDTTAAAAWETCEMDEDITYENDFCGIYYDAKQAVTNDYTYAERIVISGDGVRVYYNEKGKIGSTEPFPYTLLSDDHYDYLYFRTDNGESGHKAIVRFGADVIALLTAPDEKTEQTVTLPNNVVMDAQILVSQTQLYVRRDSGEKWPTEVNAERFWSDSSADMYIQQPYFYYPDCKLLICVFSGVSGAFYVDNESTLRSANDIMLLGVDPNAVQGPLNLADGFYLWGTPAMYPVFGALAE